MDQSMDRATATRPDAGSPNAEHRHLPYSGTEPLQQIEKDIARSRVRLSATIEALGRELSPDRIVLKGTAGLRGALEAARRSTRPQIWSYAIPLTLIAGGLGWLFMVRGRSSGVATPRKLNGASAGEVGTDQAPAHAASYAGLTAPAGSLSQPDERSPLEYARGRFSKPQR